MLSGISMTCFVASYLVALALEVSRLFLRVSVRTAIALAMALAGLFAHTVYLLNHMRDSAAAGDMPFSWYHWCLMAAWVIAAVYVGSALAHPKTSFGVFMLPIVLLLTAVAYPFRDQAPFTRGDGYLYWGRMHGMLLLAGTVVVLLGFLSGVMFLIQAYRLKHKLPPRQGMRLPSLEMLQKLNRRAVVFSACLLAGGFLSGVLLNVARGAFSWFDPLIVSSGILFLWMVVVVVIELTYPSARRGKKMAYLTVASFLFLALVLGMVLFGPTEHTRSAAPEKSVSGMALATGPVDQRLSREDRRLEPFRSISPDGRTP
jgi:ABC-type uncharacterized transport system permease subunit